MSRPNTPAWKTLSWPSFNAALKRRGSLSIWFDPGMAWAAKPTGKRGRQPVYSDAAAQTCLTMKVLLGMALRQTTGFVESLLCLIGLGWDVPDVSTLSRRQKTLAENIPHRGSQGPLHLLIDIEPVSATDGVDGSLRWPFHSTQHGTLRCRKREPSTPSMAHQWLTWRKVHLGIDVEALEIRAAEVTTSDMGDAPMLLDQIPPEQEIASVTADGAYDLRKCHDAIAEHGAEAVIPPRKNAKPWKAITAGAAARNEALRASKYLGPALWRRWSGDHRRSRAETKMHGVKLPGQRLMARDFDRQVAEFQIRVAVLNGYTALGIPVTKLVG
ncbi:MAG: IS5 family transposase [Tabrizicola sp.]|nr:IS5 family transposase [Tabrizicola sp.]